MNITRHIFSGLAVTAILGTGGCGTSDTAAPTAPMPPPTEQVSNSDAAWQEFTSAPGNFALLMPGVPVAKTETLPTEAGPIDDNSFMLRARQGKYKAAYLMSYSDYPPGSTQKLNPNDFLEKSWQGSFGALGDKLVYKKTITFNGFAGIDFQYRGKGTLLVTGRNYLIHDRIYQLCAVMHQAQEARGDAQKYLDSFRLLK